MGGFWYCSWLLYWAKQSVDGYERLLWERLAFAARYGKQPLNVLLHMETRAVLLFCDALASIVREENRKPGT